MHTQILQILANVIESGMCQTRKSQWLRAHTHAKHNKVEWTLLLLNYNIRYSSDLYENLNFSHTNVIRFNIVIPKWRSGWRSSRESSWRKFTCFMSYSSDWEKKNNLGDCLQYAFMQMLSTCTRVCPLKLTNNESRFGIRIKWADV